VFATFDDFSNNDIGNADAFEFNTVDFMTEHGQLVSEFVSREVRIDPLA
jgi:hypothetical protein